MMKHSLDENELTRLAAVLSALNKVLGLLPVKVNLDDSDEPIAVLNFWDGDWLMGRIMFEPSAECFLFVPTECEECDNDQQS
jgi:hypothetical protein